MPYTIHFVSYHIHIERRDQHEICKCRSQHREDGSPAKPYLAQLIYPQRTEKEGGCC